MRRLAYTSFVIYHGGKMSFGEALRRFREKAGMTQAALADKSGIPLRTIQGWEQDYRSPVSADFFTVAYALGVSADVFAKEFETKPRKGRGKRK
jgi:transcriptional regulator with XRE-family HTH domain